MFCEISEIQKRIINIINFLKTKNIDKNELIKFNIKHYKNFDKEELINYLDTYEIIENFIIDVKIINKKELSIEFKKID